MGKFVLFVSEYDYYNYIFKDIMNARNVVYLNTRFGQIPKFLRPIYRIHNYSFKGKLKNTPFKSIWNRLYFNEASSDEKIYFVFVGQGYFYKRTKYFEYLKKKYPKAKLIFYFTDKVESYYQLYGDFSIDYMKKTFDLILSVNKLDVEKYNIKYYPLMASKIDIDIQNETKESDIFFAGASKGRLSMIHEIYNLFTDKGYICDLHVSEVDNTEKLVNSTINYNNWMSYNDVLKRVNSTKILLEIIADGSVGYTMRYNEALLYGKLLLTNNPILKDKSYIQNIYYFNNVNEIDFEEIEARTSKITIAESNEYSPKYFLEYLSSYPY